MHLSPSRHCHLLLLLALCLLTGCTSNKEGDLKLVPVKGKLTEKGGNPVTAGMLEFKPAGDATVGTAIADIGPDGSFTARTSLQQKPRDGMAPGSYSVSYFPPMGEDQLTEPMPLPGEVTIPDGGFPDSNPLKIELPPMKKR